VLEVQERASADPCGIGSLDLGKAGGLAPLAEVLAQGLQHVCFIRHVSYCTLQLSFS
jgi:hypothetical protein